METGPGHTSAAAGCPGGTVTQHPLNVYTYPWPDPEERIRAAIDKAYADRPEEGAEARAAA